MTREEQVERIAALLAGVNLELTKEGGSPAGLTQASVDEIAVWLYDAGLRLSAGPGLPTPNPSDVSSSLGVPGLPREPYEDAISLEYPSGNWAATVDGEIATELVRVWNSRCDENQLLTALDAAPERGRE